jgi:hypothetical protein
VSIAFAHLRRSTAWRLAVIVYVVIALAVGVVYYVKALSQLGDSATRNSAQTFEDREIAGGNSILVDQRVAYEARALIPESETYRVVTGSNLRERTVLTEAYAESWFTYFLMPRRPSGEARWIICYGCAPSTLGAPYEVRWQNRKGISIGRLR